MTDQVPSGRSAIAEEDRIIYRALTVPLFAYIFLWTPDLDFVLLPLLHHRSIITHSVLPALLLLLFRKRLGVAPTAGGMIGLSVHLLCDALSPPVGFGQVWLPWPVKTPLGPLSPFWLVGNAALCFILAHVMCRRLGPGVSGPIILALTSALVGASYGFFNERSALSAAVCLIFPAILGALIWRRLPKIALEVDEAPAIEAERG